MNLPWGYDQYSPIDLSLLDQHFGTLEKWREAIDAMHARGMYVVLDNTFATLGDLIGFQGYLNVTAPFLLEEHKVQWKSSKQYHDFHYSNEYNTTCQYPKLWSETGYPVGDDVTQQMVGCYAGEFDQYGDTEAFGVYPDWRRQLSKFASVQDRLREWHEPTRLKIENFYCMMIAQLDIDGYRYDKAVQSTVDAMGFMNQAMRNCARRFGKKNFFLPGEITGGNVFGSLYIGRGRQPDMRSETLSGAVQLTNTSDRKYFLRPSELAGLDGAAFHYTVYRTLTRFLGMDGNLAAGYDSPLNWVDMWNDFLLSNDLVNTNTGEFDPRHMYGVTNQDVFRWPAIENGTLRQLLGHFVTTLIMPGIPLILWGEEQAYYVLDNTATNYIFGRQPMSAATAWKSHGCYSFETPSTQYYQMPLDSARRGCEDDTVTYDHRDPSHPIRNTIKHMFNLRQQYPVLNDGFFLQQLSNQTEQILYPGSSGVATETGLWSVMRGQFAGVQNLSSVNKAGDQHVWLIYSNQNKTKNYQFDCANNDTNMNITGLISPFDTGKTVKNLFYPFDELTLDASPRKLGIDGSTAFNGCVRNLTMNAYGFKAYVPIDSWTRTRPMITRFAPGHDARLLSNVSATGTEPVNITIIFSAEMNCDSVTNSLTLNSTNSLAVLPYVDPATVSCKALDKYEVPTYPGGVPGEWSWSATVRGVPHGIHQLNINRPRSSTSAGSTNATDHFLFRTGALDNPMIFPLTANYSTSLLTKTETTGELFLRHSAPGADMWRYSTNFGSSFSQWMKYTSDLVSIQPQNWSGTKQQRWDGEHVQVQYFSRLTGSSSYLQEGDANDNMYLRRFPHLFLNGPYNQYGYDAGLANQMIQSGNSTWEFHFMTEWRKDGTLAQINVWGMNPDGKPDQTQVYGDADGDSVLDRLPPSALSAVVLNITESPPKPYLGWRFVVDDASLRFRLIPAGNMWYQLVAYILLLIVPIISGGLAVWAFMSSFYQVKFNEVGISSRAGYIPLMLQKKFTKISQPKVQDVSYSEKPSSRDLTKRFSSMFTSGFLQPTGVLAAAQEKRRTILIATMEYDIEDWGLKVKIGGLGVMAQLMGKNLGHQDLIWVVPCVGDIDYPQDAPADPMVVTIMGSQYEIKVQYHVLRNIKYVLLDAPVFRQQTKAEPYPPRMDDMPSAIYYSAWNQCIAQAIERFPIDLYHINDYHGTIAPLYLLPKTIPACLSLHNAEFQGLWPMRNKEESDEVCSVFNLTPKIVSEYVQFGEVFNLLHGGASYLRVHQHGFGAVGVSKKYGKRAHARYPIFWGLKKIGKLPNPDPSDTGVWDKVLPKESDIHVDSEYEAGRGELRKQAQEWAGLDQNPDAELFVFVGRWSMQKGIDLIADIFPSILEAHPNAQLITVGPVIDLYGKFAAAKFDQMMKVYPGRVCSKPVFTALPPFIFSGAEFALIPSRDEPFGLVAVEFGRKGALGVGARVGGLGQMPGWWYTVESTSTSHLLHQFRVAIEESLACKKSVRAMMRARSAKQRFPVAQWVEDLEILQGTSIRIHGKFLKTHPVKKPVKPKRLRPISGTGSTMSSAVNSPSWPATPAMSRRNSFVGGGFSAQGNRMSQTQSHFREHLNEPLESLGYRLAEMQSDAPMGTQHGPGHAQEDGGATVHNNQGFHAISDYRSKTHPNDGSDHEESDMEDIVLPDQAVIRGRRMSAREVYIPNSPGLPQPPFSLTLPDSPGLRPLSMGSELDLEIPPHIHFDVPSSAGIIISSSSLLSVNDVVGDKINFNLQKVDPFFTDSAGVFYHQFQRKLEGLSGTNSETATCIEEFLVKSEKKWFEAFRNAKLGRANASRENLTMLRNSRNSTRENSRVRDSYPPSVPPPVPRIEYIDSQAPTAVPSTATHSRAESIVSFEEHRGSDKSTTDEFLLGPNFKAPTGLANWMQIRIGDWPIYSFLMAFGQIIAANSYQITLLTGEVGQAAGKLYAIASIYLVTSIMWWMLYRRFPSKVCLSFPFIFYGLAFVFIGTAHYASSISSRGWMQNVGSGLYAVASSSGSIYFSLNFGDEGGAQVKAWVFRACVIQGTQQIYVVVLWYWGSVLSKRAMAGLLPTEDSFANTWKITAVTLPIALLFWTLALIMWYGLPKYYNQQPGAVPDFYRSVTRRKIVLWFFVTVLIQNFFLSAPYGRNWSFLFSSTHASPAQIIGLIAGFFIIVWVFMLGLFAHLSKSHTWILPLFAIGLGAPRWAQIWWGTSNIGTWLPWAGNATASALVSRCLWLWLGVLDSIQGVGLGMILLGTLTRVHVCFTLIMAQVLGSIATMVARACAPNRIGPGPISPDISGGLDGLRQAWFWVGLIMNLLICVGYFLFYRKEQLTKP